MSFRIALVQPITVAPPDDEANVAAAVEWIARAAREGADFVCFPESYPGPWRMPAHYDPAPAIAEAAAKHGVHAVFGTVEPIDEVRFISNLSTGQTGARIAAKFHASGHEVVLLRGSAAAQAEGVPSEEFSSTADLADHAGVLVLGADRGDGGARVGRRGRPGTGRARRGQGPGHGQGGSEQDGPGDCWPEHGHGFALRVTGGSGGRKPAR